MKSEYLEYIANIHGEVRGKCAKYTTEMQKIFPELIRVRGHYFCPYLGKQPHWWLKTDYGEIVDPTARQFMTGGHYEEIDESLPQPTGKCPNCGEYCFEDRSLCSKKCEIEYEEYLKT